MEGDRINGLKQAMLMLASGAGTSSDRYARFQNREEVGIITFSSQPDPTVLFPMGSTAAENAKARADITAFIQPLFARGSTAIYSSIQRALLELSDERSHQKDKRYYTVVLMTDGENNRGLSRFSFEQWYRSQENVHGIPVFPILFGEGDASELTELATITGGRMFDSRSSSLASVFKEIRGYQ
jgi:Ca-activated chloride channel family protein